MFNIKKKIMKKIFLIIFTLILGTNAESQSFGDILIAGLDGILQTDNIDRKINNDQQILLGAISGLLKKKSSRDHELNIANAQSTSITLSGMNSQMSALNGGILSRDLEGNIYFTLNGTTTKINQEVVERTKNFVNTPEIKNSTLQSYNLNELKEEFNFEKEKTFIEKEEWYRYNSIRYANSVFLNTIVSKYNISKDDIYFMPYIYNRKKKGIEFLSQKFSFSSLFDKAYSATVKNRILKVYNSQHKLNGQNEGCMDFTNSSYTGKGGFKYYFTGFDKAKSASGFAIFLHIKKQIPILSYKTKIVTTFTCNWSKDFEGNGYDFTDFHGIKRSFKKNNEIQFVTGYTSEKKGSWKFDVYNNSNGSIILTDSGLISEGANFIISNLSSENLPFGVYIYNITLNSYDNDKVSKSEKFEIIE